MNNLTDRTRHHLTSSPRGVLRCLLLVVAALMPGVAPSLGMRGVTECEAPVDDAESSEAVAARCQFRSRIQRHQPRTRILSTAHLNARPVRVGAADRVARSGHRLPNNLMAPLRL